MKTNAKSSNRTIYLTPSGYRVGAKGTLCPRENIPMLLGVMDKGNARKLRKALRANGWTKEAAAKAWTEEDHFERVILPSLAS